VYCSHSNLFVLQRNSPAGENLTQQPTPGRPTGHTVVDVLNSGVSAQAPFSFDAHVTQSTAPANRK